MDSDLNPTQFHLLLALVHKGDRQALDVLLRHASRRLEKLAPSMLRHYPLVRRHEQTGDVVQEALLTLIGALKQLHFASPTEFFGLAAEHLRRRLLDLTRRYAVPTRSPVELTLEKERSLRSQDSDDDVERWQALHEAAELLPPDCREVFSMRFYQGWGQEQIAEALQISPRTVTRLWTRAVLALSEQVGAGGTA
jgi:RNA polymerase sigma-70 factor (ECF subfamily)